jgi:opacity protein-like surface antigen
MRRLVSVMLCLALWGAAPTWAGLDAKNGELGFDFGYAHFDSDVSDKGAARFNFRGGYCFTKLFELEGEGVGIVSQDTGFPDVTTALSVDFVNAVFNFHPSNKAVVPYVLVGVGHATLEFDLDPGPDVDDSGVAYQLAGGSRFFFGDKKRVAVRVELSLIDEDTFDETSTHVSLTGGFTWRLGGQK